MELNLQKIFIFNTKKKTFVIIYIRGQCDAIRFEGVLQWYFCMKIDRKNFYIVGGMQQTYESFLNNFF